MNKYDGLNESIMRQYAPRRGRRELLPNMTHAAQLALMCRVLHSEGWNDHIAGHLTFRQADGTILCNPWELAWDEVCASDVLTLDSEGNIVEGEWNVTPAIALHIQLHAQRPDVHVIAHHHPRWSGLWADMQRVPPIYDQSGAYVAGELPLFNEYDGTFEDSDRTMAAVTALGQSKWALLAHHGSLVVAKDLRQLHLRVATLEWRCKRAWEIELGGGAKPLSEGEIEKVAIADDNGFPFLYEAMARRELRKDPGILD